MGRFLALTAFLAACAAVSLGLLAAAYASSSAPGPSMQAPTATPTCTWETVRTPTPLPTYTPTGDPPTYTPSATAYGTCPHLYDPAGSGPAFNKFTVPIWRLDVGNDNDIDSGDQLFIAQSFMSAPAYPTEYAPTGTPTVVDGCYSASGGVLSTCTPAWTATATGTPTDTPTPAATATNTPTFTPTFPAYVYRGQIVDDYYNQASEDVFYCEGWGLVGAAAWLGLVECPGPSYGNYTLASDGITPTLTPTPTETPTETATPAGTATFTATATPTGGVPKVTEAQADNMLDGLAVVVTLLGIVSAVGVAGLLAVVVTYFRRR